MELSPGAFGYEALLRQRRVSRPTADVEVGMVTIVSKCSAFMQTSAAIVAKLDMQHLTRRRLHLTTE